ncbi:MULTISPECIES: hypothetical protein [Roseateles]|nr:MULTISPECIES: hypothetical protein [unclassified Roseateles]HEV6965092.1 hypothetical protein [Roseateles sp.]
MHSSSPSVARRMQRGLGLLVFASGSIAALALLMQVHRLAH